MNPLSRFSVGLRALAPALWLSCLTLASPSSSQSQSNTAQGAGKAHDAAPTHLQGRFAVRLNGGQSWRTHHSMDLYTTDNQLRIMGVGVGVDAYHGSSLSLSIEADWAYEKASSKNILGGNFDSWYNQHEGELGALLRYHLQALHPNLRILSAHVRGFGLLARTTQRLAQHRGPDYHPSPQWTPGAGAALGLTLQTPSLTNYPDTWFPIISLGFRIEYGYKWVQGAAFELDAKNSGSQAIDLHNAALGDLHLSTAFLRLSLELRI